VVDIAELAPWFKRLERACDHDLDGHSVLEIVEGIKSGQFLAFVVGGTGLVVVEVLEREHRVLNVVACAGWGMPRWIQQMVAFLQQLATDQGCAKVRVQGRRGWIRVLQGLGFTYRASVLEMTNG